MHEISYEVPLLHKWWKRVLEVSGESGLMLMNAAALGRPGGGQAISLWPVVSPGTGGYIGAESAQARLRPIPLGHPCHKTPGLVPYLNCDIAGKCTRRSTSPAVVPLTDPPPPPLPPPPKSRPEDRGCCSCSFCRARSCCSWGSRMERDLRQEATVLAVRLEGRS